MPWTAKQHRLFEVAAHNPEVARRVGIPVVQAKKMASEGISSIGGIKGKDMAKALRIKK